MSEFKTIIKSLRDENSLTQRDLAIILHTVQNTVSLWELGKRYPDAEMLIKIATHFEISIDYLLGLTDIPQLER